LNLRQSHQPCFEAGATQNRDYRRAQKKKERFEELGLGAKSMNSELFKQQKRTLEDQINRLTELMRPCVNNGRPPEEFCTNHPQRGDQHREREKLRGYLLRVEKELSRPLILVVQKVNDNVSDELGSEKLEIESALQQCCSQIICLQLKLAGLTQFQINEIRKVFEPLNLSILKMLPIMKKMESTHSHCIHLLTSEKLQLNGILPSLRGFFSSYCMLKLGLDDGNPTLQMFTLIINFFLFLTSKHLS